MSGPNATCIFERCDRPTGQRREYCQTHYMQKRRGVELTPVGRPGNKKGSKRPIRPKPDFDGCGFDGCDDDKAYGRTGLCFSHYQQQYRGEELRPVARFFTPSYNGAKCAFDPCERDARAKGLCFTHRSQQREGRELSILWVDMPEGPCSFNGCERPWKSHGLCATHNEQRLKGRGLRPINFRISESWAGVECGFDGCGFQAKCDGLCSAHYQQHRKGQKLRPVQRYKKAEGYKTEVPLRVE